MRPGLLILCVIGSACSPEVETAQGRLSGQVLVAAPVEGMVVSSYQVRQDGPVGRELGRSEPTAADGMFSVDIGNGHDTILLIATPASPGKAHYTEPASGEVVSIDSQVALNALVRDVEPNQKGDRVVVISPLSHLGHALALARMGRADSSKLLADEAAAAEEFISEHVGGLSFTSVIPQSLSKPTTLDEPAKFGLILAGLSQLSLDMSKESGAAAHAVTTLALTLRLGDDIADGVFDGRDSQKLPITVGTCGTICKLDANTLRAELARKMITFIKSERNRSGLAKDDIVILTDAIATNRQAQLFPETAPLEPVVQGPLFEIEPAHLVDQRHVQFRFTGATRKPCFFHRIEPPPPQITVPADVFGETPPEPTPVYMYSGSFYREANCEPPADAELAPVELGSLSWTLRPLQMELAEVRYRVVPPDGSAVSLQIAKKIEGSDSYSIDLSAEEVPALARLSGVWRVEIEVVDPEGHIKRPPHPIRWQHNLFAGPFEARVEPTLIPHKEGYFDGLPYQIERLPWDQASIDHYAMAQRIALARIRLTNTTPVPIYLDRSLEASFVYHAVYQQLVWDSKVSISPNTAGAIQKQCSDHWYLPEHKQCVRGDERRGRVFKREYPHTYEETKPVDDNYITYIVAYHTNGRSAPSNGKSFVLPPANNMGVPGELDLYILSTNWDSFLYFEDSLKNASEEFMIESKDPKSKHYLWGTSGVQLARAVGADKVETGTLITYLQEFTLSVPEDRPMRLTLEARLTAERPDKLPPSNITRVAIPFSHKFADSDDPLKK